MDGERKVVDRGGRGARLYVSIITTKSRLGVPRLGLPHCLQDVNTLRRAAASIS